MLAVAEEVFAERGYVATSMDEIAERVGVSKTMIYEYFGSKEGLLVACIKDARAELLRATTESALGARNAEELLRRGLVAYFTFIAAHSRSWAVLQTESAVIGSATEEIETGRRQQAELLIANMQALATSPARVNFEALAEVIIGGCERLALWLDRHGGMSPEQAAEHVMQLVWFGLRQMAQPS